VRIIAFSRLRDFWRQPGRADAEQPLRAWYAEAKKADWRLPSDVKAAYGNASLLPGNRVVFNVAGNKYRLIVAVKYEFRLLYVRFVGTHSEYDRIDAERV
jgi:mRNA interferase HigB